MYYEEEVHLIFEYLSQWPVQAFHLANYLLKTHAHVIHIVSLSIFFGPIVALLPFLFLHELAISLLFNLSFVMHGLLPGTADSRYDWLRSTLDDTRESLYSSVDATGAIYNKWTTENIPLIILRLVALVIGGYALFGIWTSGDPY
ncbi:hypothetical protein L208DRAFT_1289713 [Tricholoma matsutake]|nr:hypothetical protein L208DRAFT_1289713 [Tricholoma matsutake 945]